ncbi:aminoacyl-tRNA hydrolase [Asaia sp. W19]|uniref:aminoacyl-tRNA hydrolase n=1 Tax=unclassified Asaia TaxID=2685023 RepID=UPI000F8DAB7F|nr:aminoacyl-tRNA hydrolase [Asaia sp. W19]RUT24278.1 aminoacyl-tRNA hydrolase [Asaia sp. W19]RUT26267.1 aminoacyl-tRNA hydrolase [Asaia sp. W19]
MLLWTGLGNPEPGMRRQRHNIGFMAVERIAEYYRFSPWRARFKGETAEGSIEGQKVLLLKPMTYMNLSGESVQQAVRFFKIPVSDITAFHDELDLAFCKVRVKRGGGAAGHNGLRSMDRMLGDQSYQRVRLGIGHPGHKDRVTGHVLGDFAKAEQTELETLLDAVAAASPLLAKGEPEATMTKIAMLCGEKR